MLVGCINNEMNYEGIFNIPYLQFTSLEQLSSAAAAASSSLSNVNELGLCGPVAA
jgi:hypothetical protein